MGRTNVFFQTHLRPAGVIEETVLSSRLVQSLAPFFPAYCDSDVTRVFAFCRTECQRTAERAMRIENTPVIVLRAVRVPHPVGCANSERATAFLGLWALLTVITSAGALYDFFSGVLDGLAGP